MRKQPIQVDPPLYFLHFLPSLPSFLPSNDANGDGIGDTPYNVESRNQDRYPLMKPWEPDTAPPRISMISPENRTYNESNVTRALLKKME